MPYAASHTARTVTLLSESTGATHAIAMDLARVAMPGDLICLWGELGAGKTVFAKGFGIGLGVQDTISSPTFVLMAEYVGRLPLFHIDLYRLAGADDAFGGGLLDDRQTAGVTIVEWPERLGAALPKARLDVRLDGSGDEERRVMISATTPDLGRYLPAAMERRTDVSEAPAHAPSGPEA